MTNLVAQNLSGGPEALFGLDPTEGLVSLDTDGNENMWVYRRTPQGVLRERAPFKPWILLTEPPAQTVPGAVYTDLEGPGYGVLAEFATQSAYRSARFELQDRHVSHLTYPGGAKMAFIRTGRTLFKGMTFSDIVRFQFDIETNGLDPGPEANRILLIAVSDNRGLLRLLEGEEPEILQQFIDLLIERDPDVIEGHNIFGFDLPFVMARAQRHGIILRLGRDGSELRQGQERNYAIGGTSRPFVPAFIQGRHIIDTYLVVQRFDWAKGALTSYGLKECARHFGFAEKDRVELPREEIMRLYRDEPELVREYARQDVVETGKLAELVTPVEFYQTQMVPDNYGQVAVTGNGEKINALFIRAYLAAGRSIPRPQPARPYSGGYTEVRQTGVLDHVVKADVESLYPSLMLTHHIAPANDSMGIFLPALRDLTQRRFDAKRKAQASEFTGATAPTGSDDKLLSHAYWDGLQGSYKVLINSFYGYLGGPFCWNDYDAAERVTTLGRDLVVGVARDLEQSGSQIIEIDTDGVYFVPPDTVREEAAEREYIARIGTALPEGIRLAFDGRFARMLSLKTKNYVLETMDGRKIFKGASLRSRADERYGRRFLTHAVNCLLEHDLQGVADLYAETIDNLLNRRIPIEDLARRERVTEKTFQSEQKRRSAAVAEGVPIGEHVMVYERADGALGLLSDYHKDENPKYYMDKLYKFAKRLEEAFGGQFDKFIPKPTAQGLPVNLQTTLDLFG